MTFPEPSLPDRRADELLAEAREQQQRLASDTGCSSTPASRPT